MLIAGFAYRGKQGESYSPFNHFISELGEVSISRLAGAFNFALVIGGICQGVGSISLGLILPGTLAKIGMVAGIVCSLALSLVGVFHMGNWKPHAFTAMMYFRSGLVMVILFCLAIALQPSVSMALPRLYALAGLPAIFSFGYFLVLLNKALAQEDQPFALEEDIRPRVLPLAVVEWMIFITLVLWLMVIATGLLI